MYFSALQYPVAASTEIKVNIGKKWIYEPVL